MLCLLLFTFYFPHIFIALHDEFFDKIKTFKVSSCVFSHQQPKIHVISKQKQITVIRGTKDRPPQRGSLKTGVTSLYRKEPH